MAAAPTLRRRVALWMSGFAVMVLAAASVAIFLGGRYVLQITLDETLLAMARTEVASAIDSPGGPVHVHDERWVPITLPSGEGYEKYALIADTGGQILARTANIAGGPPLRADARRQLQALRGRASFGFAWRGGERLRAVYYPLRDGAGNRLVAVIAVPMQPMYTALRFLSAVLLGALAVGTLGAAWGARWVAARLTRPLEAIAAAAQRINDQTPAARIPDTSPDAELRTLTGVLNATLARLQAALETERRLIADASHELRTPLTNLRGTVEVALRRPRQAAEYEQTLRECRAEIERLCRLVEELLVLSRADAGQLSLSAAPLDLVSLARAAVRAHAPRAAEAGVELVLAAEGDAVVAGDADRLRSLIDNLLDNALRHAPRGSAVEIAVGRAGAEAVLSVRDQGPGLSPEQQAHVFDRFYRVDPARQRHSGGAGLGLAIAKVVAEAHGGRLGVESTSGSGATFILRLPVVS
jgi:two-component system OmpR family sensor kinase